MHICSIFLVTFFSLLNFLFLGTGVMHQVNLEYLARVVSVQDDQILFPGDEI